MKFNRLATITALSATMLGTSIQVFADEEEPKPSKEARTVITDGEVRFSSTGEDGEGEDTITNPPAPGPDVTIPPVPGPDGGNKGPLTIAYVPTMNFGSQIISNQDQQYSMLAEMQQKTGTTGETNKVPYVSFAEVQDTRGSNAGWDLRVRLSDFTSSTQNNRLTGARITLRDPRIVYLGNNQANAPVSHANNFVLEPGTGSVSVMNAIATKGAGSSSVVWGNQAALDQQFANPLIKDVRNDAIVLSVPGRTEKDATTYKSTLTWDLTALPGNNEPNPDDE